MTTTGPSYRGPAFRLVEQIDWTAFSTSPARLSARKRPLLIKAAIRHWPATERWTFTQLAQMRRPDGTEVVAPFQIGIAEQGASRADVIQPVAPYLQSLARAQTQAYAVGDDRLGLLSADRHAALSHDQRFHLDWSYMRTLPRDQPYISLWHILDQCPQLRKDLRVSDLWPGLRWDWAYTFLGPGRSVTGFHYDYPNNLFCQISGTKEFLLVPPEQSARMSPSDKYDWGGKMSHVDITRLDEQPQLAATFADVQGLYGRVEAGDALYVPRRTWHAVVSSVPSVSLAVFGLSPWELIADGLPSVFRAALHAAGLYGRGNCTCHGVARGSQEITVPGAAANDAS